MLTRNHREFANLFVQFLAIAARLDRIHHDVLGRHERKLCHEALLNDLRVDHEAIHDVHIQAQNAVYREEALRNRETLVRGIVERALEPLSACDKHRVHHIAHHIVRETRHALAAHGVPLVSHGRRADLALLKGLLNLL